MPWSDHAGGERSSRIIDALDRVLDKGIVVDAWVRMSAAGINPITVDTRVVVASLDTYVTCADAVRTTPRYGVPMLGRTPSGGAARHGADEPDLPASEAVVRAAEDYLRQLP